MSEYDDLIEGYELASEDPGPLSDEENQQLQETILTRVSFDPSDWPGGEELHEEAQAALAPPELRALRPDQVPLVGSHYVIFGGLPRAVVRAGLHTTEDEFVRGNLSIPSDLKDIDGQRQQRAARTLRMRYRGYLCGEMSSL